MSYQLLPPEIKQYITNEIHRSDVRGRGICNWSRTSKECREMCLPLLFGTLEDAKAVDKKFQYEILDNPIANAVHHLVLNGNTTDDKLTLLLFHIVPRFNNLAKITIGDAEYIGLPTDFRFDRLLKIAKNINNWTFIDPDASQLKPLLAANLHIHTLSFDVCDAWAWLLENIAKSPSLANLSMRLTRQYGPAEPIFDALSLAVDFPNSDNLHSLTLTSDSDPLDYSVLEFASKFPNLSSLRLSAIAFQPPVHSLGLADGPPTPISFPNLRHLELSFSILISLRKVLECSFFATLRSLRLGLSEWSPSRNLPGIDRGRESTEYDLLPSQIQKSCPVVDLVIVEAESPKNKNSIMLLKMDLDQALRRHEDRQEEEEKHKAGSDSDKQGQDGGALRGVEGEEQCEEESVEESGEEAGEVTADRIERPSISFRTIAEYSRSHVENDGEF
ncbi:hypothetical protein JCM5350_008238 [Sporobolomyces pararoseus]